MASIASSRPAILCGVLCVALVAGGCAPPQAALKQAEPPTVIVQRFEAEDIRPFDEFSGRFEATETVEVRSRVRGHLVEVNFTDGQHVHLGDVLFRIDERSYKASYDQAAARRVAALAQQELAKSDYDRAKLLFDKKAASQQDLDSAIAHKAVADADVVKADADVEAEQLNLDFCVIKSDIDGRISRAQTTKGNLVNAGGGDTLLTTIVSIDPIYVYFDVDENSMQRYATASRAAGVERLENIKEAKIPVFVSLGTERDFPHEGIIDFVDNKVDAGTGTIKARGLLPNANGILLPGFFAKVRVYRPSAALRAVRIPDRAIGSDLGTKFVLVVGEGDTVERRTIDAGPMQDGLRVVRSGLTGGERVIVSGMQRAKPGAKVTPREEAQREETSSRQATKGKTNAEHQGAAEEN